MKPNMAREKNTIRKKVAFCRILKSDTLPWTRIKLKTSTLTYWYFISILSNLGFSAISWDEMSCCRTGRQPSSVMRTRTTTSISTLSLMIQDKLSYRTSSVIKRGNAIFKLIRDFPLNRLLEKQKVKSSIFGFEAGT